MNIFSPNVKGTDLHSVTERNENSREVANGRDEFDAIAIDEGKFPVSRLECLKEYCVRREGEGPEYATGCVVSFEYSDWRSSLLMIKCFP